MDQKGIFFRLLTIGLCFSFLNVVKADPLTFYTIAQQFDNTLYKVTYDGWTAPVPTLIGLLDSSSPSTAVFAFGGLAWNNANSTLYMVDGLASSGKLYTVNTGSGTASLVANIGVQLSGLAYDFKNGLLYGYEQSGSSASGGLYKLSISGTVTRVSTSTTHINGLSYDSLNDRLVGSVPNGGLYSLDITTGASTLLSSISGAKDNNGTVYDPVSKNYFGIDYARDFYSVDGTTYAITSISSSILQIQSSNPRPDGLAIVIGAVPEPGSIALMVAGLVTAGGVQILRRRKCPAHS